MYKKSRPCLIGKSYLAAMTAPFLALFLVALVRFMPTMILRWRNVRSGRTPNHKPIRMMPFCRTWPAHMPWRLMPRRPMVARWRRVPRLMPRLMSPVAATVPSRYFVYINRFMMHYPRRRGWRRSISVIHTRIRTSVRMHRASRTKNQKEQSYEDHLPLHFDSSLQSP